MDRLKIFIKSFLSLLAFMRLMGMSTRNPISILLFIVLLYIFSKFSNDSFQTRISSIDITLSSILSVLFTLFTVSARYSVILDGLTNKLFCITILGFSAIGLLIIFYHACMWVLVICGSLSITNSSYSSPLLPYITFIICMLCWLPYFLYEYPGIMTPDSVNQLCQVLGLYELSNHHSIVHTAIIGLCYNIGIIIFGNIYAAIALYTIVQMIFMAFSAGYVVRTLQKASAITPVIIITILFYALMPYNITNAVTMLKDNYFAGFMTILAAALMRLALRDSKEKLSISEWITIVIPYIISSIMVCVLRGNGWYAFLLTIPFVLFIYRKNFKVMIPVHIVILLIVLFIKYPLMDIYEIKQADYVESISIPVQQIARVIANGEQLNENEYEYISQIMDIEQVPLIYSPNVSDGIKNLIRQTGLDYLVSTKSDFFKIWLSIGVKHPKAYFEAYVDQTVGFWYPDIDSEIGLADGIYENPLNLSWQPIFQGFIFIKIKEIILKLPSIIPLYGLLWSMGFIFWVILLLTALCLRSGSEKNAVILLPFILLTLTLCIATPVANEFRYSYPLFFAFPILFMAPFMHKNS